MEGERWGCPRAPFLHETLRDLSVSQHWSSEPTTPSESQKWPCTHRSPWRKPSCQTLRHSWASFDLTVIGCFLELKECPLCEGKCPTAFEFLSPTSPLSPTFLRHSVNSANSYLLSEPLVPSTVLKQKENVKGKEGAMAGASEYFPLPPTC